MYKNHLSADLENFIGVKSKVPYAIPAQPDFIVDKDQDSELPSIPKIIDYFVKLDTALILLA